MLMERCARRADHCRNWFDLSIGLRPVPVPYRATLSRCQFLYLAVCQSKFGNRGLAPALEFGKKIEGALYFRAPLLRPVLGCPCRVTGGPLQRIGGEQALRGEQIIIDAP